MARVYGGHIFVLGKETKFTTFPRARGDRIISTRGNFDQKLCFFTPDKDTSTTIVQNPPSAQKPCSCLRRIVLGSNPSNSAYM
jgi:hypothetical protein